MSSEDDTRFAAGVLSHSEIKSRVDGEPVPRLKLIHPMADENLRAARYDVRMALDGCITPDGDRLKVDGGRKLAGPLVLHSGDTAWISTQEQFCIPANITGTVTLKTNLANRGMWLLSGTLIDPFYGYPDEDHRAEDRRLRFFVANLGTQAIVIEPEKTEIAAVQFFTVVGDCERTEPPRAPEAPASALGFIDNLKHLQRDYHALDQELARTREVLQGLIVLGYFVLGTAVLGAALATLLTIGSNADLVKSVDRAVPNSLAGKGLIAVMASTFAWTIYSVAIMLGPKRAPARGAAASRTDPREVALNALRDRARGLALRVLIGLPFLLSVVIWAGLEIDAFSWGFWPTWVLAGSVLVFGVLEAVRRASPSPAEAEIRAEMDRLAR